MNDPVLYWCNSHEREATAVDQHGRRCCDPRLAGILAICSVVDLTGEAELVECA